MLLLEIGFRVMFLRGIRMSVIVVKLLIIFDDDYDLVS